MAPIVHRRSNSAPKWIILVALLRATCACRNLTEDPQPTWASLHQKPGSDAPGAGPPPSLWPFFRDLDLLRLLEHATSRPATGSARQQGQQGQQGEDRCRDDLNEYLQGLRNFSTWAVQMWDSSVRSPRGALWGELWQMGNFDECLGVNDAAPLRHHLPGAAFCLLTLRLRDACPPSQGPGQGSEASARAVFKPPQHRMQVARHVLRWGVCVPSSCGPPELTALLAPPLRLHAAPLGLEAELSVDPRMWHDQHGQPHSVALWTALLWLLVWIVFCTVFECSGMSGLGAGPAGCLQAFSVRRNWCALVSSQQQPVDDREHIALIDAAKTVGVVLVILGHRGEALMAGPIMNGVDVEKMYSSVLDVLVMNGSVVVDFFFVAGGCLLSWTLLGHLQRGKQQCLLAIYAYRYLRLIPAYAVTVAVLAVGLPSLGSGPLWSATTAEEAERCRKRWWTNMLFVNNLVRPDEPCLDPSWYLACDFQLFVLAAPLVPLIHCRPRLAARLLGAALLVAIAYPAAVTWRLGLDGVIIPYPDSVGHMAATAIHMHVYVSALCRAGPYVLGVAAGWYLRHLRARRAAPHPALSWLLLPLAALAVAVVLGASAFYPPLVAARPPRWVHVVYAGTYRTACALSYAVVLVVVAGRAHSASDKSPGRSGHAFRLLSRLSYCAYLTHALVQLHSIGQQRAAAVYSTADVITQTVPDVVFAFLCALVLHLAVEAPCNALLRLARHRGR